ncbi:hypothetical protein ACHAWF_006779 [Thalassiosira exigua]
MATDAAPPCSPPHDTSHLTDDEWITQVFMVYFKGYGPGVINRELANEDSARDIRARLEEMGQAGYRQILKLVMTEWNCDLDGLKKKVGSNDCPWSLLVGQGGLRTPSLSALIGVGHDETNRDVRKKVSGAAGTSDVAAHNRTAFSFGSTPKSAHKTRPSRTRPTTPRRSGVAQNIRASSAARSSTARSQSVNSNRAGLEEFGYANANGFGSANKYGSNRANLFAEEDDPPQDDYKTCKNEEGGKEEVDNPFPTEYTAGDEDTITSDMSSLGLGMMSVDGDVELKNSDHILYENPLPEIVDTQYSDARQLDKTYKVAVDFPFEYQKERIQVQQSARGTRANLKRQRKFRMGQIAVEKKRALKASKEKDGIEDVVKSKIELRKKQGETRKQELHIEHTKKLEELKSNHEAKLKAEDTLVTKFENTALENAKAYGASCEEYARVANDQARMIEEAMVDDLAEVEAKLKVADLATSMLGYLIDSSRDQDPKSAMLASNAFHSLKELVPFMEAQDYPAVVNFDAENSEGLGEDARTDVDME